MHRSNELLDSARGLLRTSWIWHETSTDLTSTYMFLFYPWTSRRSLYEWVMIWGHKDQYLSIAMNCYHLCAQHAICWINTCILYINVQRHSHGKNMLTSIGADVWNIYMYYDQYHQPWLSLTGIELCQPKILKVNLAMYNYGRLFTFIAATNTHSRCFSKSLIQW